MSPTLQFKSTNWQILQMLKERFEALNEDPVIEKSTIRQLWSSQTSLEWCQSVLQLATWLQQPRTIDPPTLWDYEFPMALLCKNNIDERD